MRWVLIYVEKRPVEGDERIMGLGRLPKHMVIQACKSCSKTGFIQLIYTNKKVCKGTMQVESGYILQADPTKQIRLAKEPFLYKEKEQNYTQDPLKSGPNTLKIVFNWGWDWALSTLCPGTSCPQSQKHFALTAPWVWMSRILKPQILKTRNRFISQTSWALASVSEHVLCVPQCTVSTWLSVAGTRGFPATLL